MKHRSNAVLAAAAASILALGIGSRLFVPRAPSPANLRDDPRGSGRSLRVVTSFVDPRSIVAKDAPVREGPGAPAADGYRFLRETDLDAIVGCGGFSDKKNRNVVYVRPQEELAGSVGAGDGRCNPMSLDVLAWLMDKVNARKGTLMITYGGLLHLYREKDFVDPATGAFLDNDFDLWASLETFEMIASLEPALYRFGWSLRLMTNGPYVVFMQVFAVCGHDFSEGKVAHGGANVGLEIYPLPTMPLVPGDRGYQSGAPKSRDIFSRHSFPTSMVYPTRRVDLRSAGSERTLHLQLPHDPEGLLRCVYGDWETPSEMPYYRMFPERRVSGNDCTDWYERSEAIVWA